MKPIAFVPRSAMAKKPPHGAPCTRCGVCCMASRCDVGLLLFGPGGACPALEPDGDNYRCGTAADPAQYLPDKTAKHGVEKVREAVLRIIYAGTGCDARFNGEPINHAFNAKMDAEYDAKKSGEALRLILL